MADIPDIHRTLPGLSPTQRSFVEAAEAMGATAPAGARSLAELPRLSTRELDDLVELGVVREAADWRYYVFRSRRGAPAGPPPLPALPPYPVPWNRGRYLRWLLVWVIILLIPVLFLQLTAGR
jgi:hypothetical protein